MRKVVFPILVTLLALVLSLVFQPSTLVFQEYEGLFLATPDYFAWLWAQPFPVSQLVSDFVTQFYRFGFMGPVIVAAWVLAAYFLGRGIWPGACAGGVAAACAEWMALAFYPTAKLGVILFWGLLILWIASRYLRVRSTLPVRWDTVACSAMLLTAALLVAFHPSIVRRERWSAVKRNIVTTRWDDVLKAATPRVAEKDREIMPFALFALGEKEQLGEKMFSYPVFEENDFDMCLEEDYENSLFYRAFLYHRLGCFNEACHELFQLATQQRHGTSAMILRQLVTEYYLLGDYMLAEKYCKVLERSSTHGAFVRTFRQFMAEGKPAPADSAAGRSVIDLITRNPSYNLMLLQDNGIIAASTQDRLYASLLLQKRLDVFGTFVMKRQERESYYPPVHFLEAMQVLFEENPSFSRYDFPMIAPQQMKRFQDFLNGFGVRTPEEQEELYGNTYWFYYYYRGE